MKATRASSVLLVAAVSCLAIASCAGKKAEVTDSPNPRLATKTIQAGGARIVAEIARTETERERGLMFRAKLADGEGMLFVFDKDEQLSFWMKNTVLPLSLAYIASDGTIRQIADLVPQSLASVKAERSVRYALEVPQGWFGRAGVRVGDRVGVDGGADLSTLD